jgi:hypothetical protein
MNNSQQVIYKVQKDIETPIVKMNVERTTETAFYTSKNVRCNFETNHYKAFNSEHQAIEFKREIFEAKIADFAAKLSECKRHFEAFKQKYNL